MPSIEDRQYRALAALAVVLCVSGALLCCWEERPEPLPDPVSVSPTCEEARWTLGLPVRINRASQDALELLPNIGPKRAGAILNARRSRGGFLSIDDIDAIRGIGPKTLEAIRPLVTLDAGTSDETVTIEFVR